MKKTSTKKKVSSARQARVSMRPKKSTELAVTQQTMDNTRAELKSEITTLRLEHRESLKLIIVNFERTRAENKSNLNEFRAELKSEINGLRTETESKIGSLHTEISNLRADMQAEFGAIRTEASAFRAEMRTEIGELKAAMLDMRLEIRSDVSRIEAAVQSLVSETHRIKAIVEEQNTKFNFALDGYAAVNYRLETIEKKIKDV